MSEGFDKKEDMRSNQGDDLERSKKEDDLERSRKADSCLSYTESNHDTPGPQGNVRVSAAAEGAPHVGAYSRNQDGTYSYRRSITSGSFAEGSSCDSLDPPKASESDSLDPPGSESDSSVHSSESHIECPVRSVGPVVGTTPIKSFSRLKMMVLAAVLVVVVIIVVSVGVSITRKKTQDEPLISTATSVPSTTATSVPSTAPPKYDIDGEQEGDGFGTYMVMSRDGNTIAAAAANVAIYQISPLIYGINRPRYINVYEKSGQQWIPKGQKIVLDEDVYYVSLALSADGSTLVTMLDYEDKEDQVITYEHNGTDYAQQGQHLTFNSTFPANSLVAMSDNGSILAVSSNPGRWTLQTFSRSDPRDGWQPLSQAIIDDPSAALPTPSLALSGDGSTVVFGICFLSSRQSKGYVRVFKVMNFMLEQVGSTIQGNTNEFGRAVATNLNGSSVIVGDPSAQADIFSVPDGAVYVYGWEAANDWATSLAIEPDDTTTANSLGWSVSMSSDGSTVSIGAPSVYENIQHPQGLVRVMRLQTDGQWTDVEIQISTLSSTRGRFYGWKVALSGDGQTLALSDPQNRNETGAETGSVRIVEVEM